MVSAERVLDTDDQPGRTTGSLRSAAKKVFVIGGVSGETGLQPRNEEEEVRHACESLGAALAEGDVQLVLCSPFMDSADAHTALGYLRAGGHRQVEFHSPRGSVIDTQFEDLVRLGRADGSRLRHFRYPEPESAEARGQAWLLCQLQALRHSDAIVAIGGRVSNTANAVLHFAAEQRMPIVPFEFLGGAARRAHDRRNRRRPYPPEIESKLCDEAGLADVVELINYEMFGFAAGQSLRASDRIFISYAKERAPWADELHDLLRSRGFEVFLDDREDVGDQTITASIRQSIAHAGVFVALWDQHYALSPYCYDELMQALEGEGTGPDVWFFELDETRVVPEPARTLQRLRVRSRRDLIQAAKGLVGRTQGGDETAEREER